MSKIEHVAIIMDGNGRWASERGHPRFWGHIRGTNTASRIVETAHQLALKSLTLFAFSTENWKRPTTEIGILFRLLHKYLIRERERILKNKMCFKVVGKIGRLPPKTQQLIQEMESNTSQNEGMRLYFAFDYGGRSEIIAAANRFMEEKPGEKLSEEIMNNYLFTEGVSDIDLLIRTSGEQRISNFLLWQLAYAELYFTSVRWPDFSEQEFRRIYQEVSLRERRFGGIESTTGC